MEQVPFDYLHRHAAAKIDAPAKEFHKVHAWPTGVPDAVFVVYDIHYREQAGTDGPIIRPVHHGRDG